MVQSNISTKINYKESKLLEEIDVGHSCSLYEIELLEGSISVAIVLGKARLDKSDVFYCPLYGVGNDKTTQFPIVKMQLGVVEAPIENAIDILGSSKKKTGSIVDVPLEKMGDILLYKFVDLAFLQALDSHPETYHFKIFKPSSPDFSPPPPNNDDKPPKQQAPPNNDDKPQINDEADDIFSIVVSKEKQESIEIIEEILENGPFRNVSGFSRPPFLQEETHRMAQKIKHNYIDSDKNPWIQKFTHNSNYSIIEVESNGDCLFAVVRDAFAHIGKLTDVQKLRALVANQVNDTIYETQHYLYVQIQQEQEQSKKELSQLKKQVNVDKKNLNNDQIKELNDKRIEFNQKVISFNKNKEILSEFKFMKDIHSVEDFRKYILTSNYWADAWAISILEEKLHFKFIILSHEAFNENAIDNVLQCGESSLAENIKPEFYVMTSYSGNHYKLISYNDQKIFTFVEIPYDIKTLIMKKCMERNSGEYNKIPDFRNWKSRFGHHDNDKNDEKPENKNDEKPENKNDEKPENKNDEKPENKNEKPEKNKKNLEQKNKDSEEIRFIYYDHSPSKPLPGKGSGETIPNNLRLNYSQLSAVENWRRMLDDSWEHEDGLFQLDNRKWKSVTHYLLGVQFKKGFPDIYQSFSIDSKTDISQDVELAKKSIVKKNGIVIINGQKQKAIPDSGFHTKIDLDNQILKGRENEQRELAVREKFNQNLELKKILKWTKPAKLMHFIRAQPPEDDIILMSLRELLT
jgi:hypothetical protein